MSSDDGGALGLEALEALEAPEPVRAWLHSFVDSSRSGADGGPGELFAEVFLTGEPGGTATVPRAAFLAALPARERMFRAAGWADPRLGTARYEPLGEHFGALVTGWQMSALDGGRSLQLRSAFVLRLHGDRAEVIAYLNDQDLGAVLGTGGGG
jgi:hypothetical protein